MSYNLDNYNPYDLLEVTKNDSDEHIAIAFRKKAKKFKFFWNFKKLKNFPKQ